MSDNYFSDNKINGDVFTGNKYTYEADLTSLEKHIRAIVTKNDTQILGNYSDDLRYYVTNNPVREIIGLENKLTQGDRSDLIDDALEAKNFFERRLSKDTMSNIEQEVFAQCLTTIKSAFTIIKSNIDEGKINSEIDTLIYEKITEPIHKALSHYDTKLNQMHVRGMLFFLTGKCHLIWRKTC